MPRSARQKNMYHIEKAKLYIMKALQRVHTVELSGYAGDPVLKEVAGKLISYLDLALAASVRILEKCSGKEPSPSEETDIESR